MEENIRKLHEACYGTKCVFHTDNIETLKTVCFAYFCCVMKYTLFCANQDLFQSKLLSKKSKLWMYQTLVRPVVTYACEMWVLKENIKSKLRVFERKVLSRIYGPAKESDGTWRIKSNDELNRLIGNKNIINYIKAQRLAWFGHVHCMPDNSMVKKKYMSGHPC